MKIGNKGRGERGQSTMEYAVVTFLLAMALGVGLTDDNSILWQLGQAFQQGYRNFSYALSLPI